MGWIDLQGATLAKMKERGGLWVVERVPSAGSARTTRWIATAEPKSNVPKLISQWAESGGVGDLPRGVQERLRAFDDAMRHAENLILIVHDAHLLRGETLDKMRLFAELGAAVVLEGDVSRIHVATENFPGFYQRAAYAVKVDRVFG